MLYCPEISRWISNHTGKGGWGWLTLGTSSFPHLELWSVPRTDKALVSANRLVGPARRLLGVLCVETSPAHFTVVPEVLLPLVPDGTGRHVKGEVRSEYMCEDFCVSAAAVRVLAALVPVLGALSWV